MVARELEQRVVKTVGSTTTHFIFDRLGHLLAEADGATGATQKEYIWLDDLPVAMVDDTGPSPVIYYIHTDNLGTPQKLTDGAMNIVWDGQFDPFGNASSITGAATMNLRFPGQYFDAETGIAQNWNRDYDPTLGRYIESDPIGLLGGINTYAYVLSQPERLTDFKGTAFVDCLKWLAELNAATFEVERRFAEIAFHGSNPDKGHIKALREANQRLENALNKVIKHCGCYVGAAAAIAAAKAAAEAAAAFLEFVAVFG